MKKLPRDAEASNVLVGEVDFLDAPFVAFVRLQQAVMLGALTEVPVPSRCLFPHMQTCDSKYKQPNFLFFSWKQTEGSRLGDGDASLLKQFFLQFEGFLFQLPTESSETRSLCFR